MKNKDKLVEQIRLKIESCSDSTREQRARKGAYVDCLVMIRDFFYKCEKRKKHVKKMHKIKQEQELILDKIRKGEEMPESIKFAKPI